MEPVRLNKYLSDKGICSRREADRLTAEEHDVTIIDLDPEMYGMEERMEKANENKDCLFLAKGKRNVFEEDVMTQSYKDPDISLYARVIWKRPSRIFDDAGKNVRIFFHVKQRRYLTGTNVSWNGFKNEWTKYLAEIYKDEETDDTLAEFFVFASYEDPQYLHWNYHLINRSLSDPGIIIGRCCPYDDFFSFYSE